MPKKTLPELYVDEHIKPAVIETFEECGFKCIRISKTKKYAGRKEQDYIQEIYAEGRLFVTSDLEFVEYVITNRIKHVGILEIPPNLDEETVITVSAVLCGLVEGHIDNYGRNSLRRQVIYVSNDGFRNIDAMGNDQLWYSFEALHVDLNTPE
jgi:predicted nuclease of predicted toxin-antitoxin system